MMKKGFTLIELLVVIAIIGILASVVLASLNTARDKGADAAIKANLSGIRAQAELFYDDTSNTYTGLCADANIVAAIDAAKSAAGVVSGTNTTYTTAGSSGTATCHESATAYGIEVPLKATATEFFCVDSTGAGAVNAATALAASDTTC